MPLVIITPAIKYLKVVIPRLDRGIQKGLDTPIKSEYDMFLLFNCRGNKRWQRHYYFFSKSFLYCPYPSFSRSSAGMNLSAAEFMQ